MRKVSTAIPVDPKRDEELIEAAAKILAAEHPMTMRQCFSRVHRMGVVQNTNREYRIFSRSLAKARSGGHIEHDWLVDPPVHETISAVLVDPNHVEELRSERRSYSEIFDTRLDKRIILTLPQAKEFKKSGFGYFAGRGRMILAMRRRDFVKLRDLSVVAGFDRAGETGEKGKPALDASWIGTFLRDRFEKGRHCL